MNKPPILPRLKGFRFPREVIGCAVRVYHRFARGTADAICLRDGYAIELEA